MTDLTNERLAALAARREGARRPGGGADEAPGTSAPAPAAGPAPTRRKRRHAAAGARILATGMSVSAALVMVGAMASTQRSDPPASQPVTAMAPPATAPPPIVVRVVLTPTPAPAAAVTAPTPAPTPVVRKAPVAAKATATSRGS